MKLSVVIPCRNEEGCVEETLSLVRNALTHEAIPYEIIVVDDGSTDSTALLVNQLAAHDANIRYVHNGGSGGFGMAVRLGLSRASGEALAVMMADGSDSPCDLIQYYRKLREGYECVFGSRFISGGRVLGYPLHKLILNRLANSFIQLLFGLRFNDTTNAFKCYRRAVLDGLQPLLSSHFNLTVELPLKAIVRGYSYAIVPITWTNRKAGISKLRIKEMGSRYLFIVLYVWLEKHLTHGDYHRADAAPAEETGTPLPHV